jgi:outer membrane receptor protein involved in Fe transport
LANVAGRGDLIEQRNQTDTLGLTARYRTAAKELGPVHAHLSVGASARLDNIEQQQNLLDAGVNSQTWDRRVDATIDAVDVGTWLDADLHWHDWVKVRLGYRADLVGYEVEDRLGNRAPATRDVDSYIVGFRRSAMGIAHGPRVSADVEPLKWLTFHASYGEGYRSPQARTLADGEPTPFSKVRSADVGTRVQLLGGTQLTVSAYHTHLSDDVAFDASEGRLERVGASVRRGGVAYLETRPMAGVVGAFSVTYVDAELLEPPPATAQEPNPPFKPGQNLPFVPPLVARADIGVEREITQAFNQSVSGRIGLGASALSSRPLPYGYFGQPFALVDASGGLGFGPANLTLSVYNVLDAQYPASEYSFVSTWDPGAPASRVPVRHVVAGAPRTVMLSLEIDL